MVCTRLRMVDSMRSSLSHTSIRMVPGVGSSRVFSSSLAAAVFIFSAIHTTIIFQPPS